MAALPGISGSGATAAPARPQNLQPARARGRIGKGKAHAPYEFGVKVSLATTLKRSKGGQFALHAKALPGNPYDGHTLATIIPDMEKTIGNQIERILADAGYRGHNAPDSYKFRVFTAGQKRRVTRRFCARCGAARQSSR